MHTRFDPRHGRSIVLSAPLIAALTLTLGGWLVASAFTSAEVFSPQPLAASLPAREAAPQAASLALLFDPAVRYWQERIMAWSAQFRLDPNLVATVMQIESCGDPDALSRSGAMGLFQVMPFHFSTGEDGFDPEVNAARGLRYLRLGLERGGGLPELALAGYNGGHSRIGQAAELWPAETRRYVYWGTGIYEDAQAGREDSARLEEWRRAGGRRLCAQAAAALGIAP
jgi:soluble lytic murein transglycosylase-like protein